jgi:hypothetical protein
MDRIITYGEKKHLNGRKGDFSANSLALQSQLIVVCRFDGVREMQNECYLSEVQVTHVIKGDNILRGQKIKVYEPIYTRIDNIQYHKIANNFSEMVKKFNWQGKTRIIVSQPYDVSNTNDYTIMAQNRNYLLFLNPKPILQGQKQPGEPEYVQLDNPYAKLTISATDAVTYKPPADLISIKDSMQYEILLQNASSIKSYFNTKMEILRQIHLQ